MRKRGAYKTGREERTNFQQKNRRKGVAMMNPILKLEMGYRECIYESTVMK